MTVLATMEDRTVAALEALSNAERGTRNAEGKDMTLQQFARLWMRGMEGSVGGGLVEPLNPYRQNLWVNLCIRKIYSTVSGIPLRLMRSGPETRIASKSFRADIRPSRRRTLRPLRGFKSVCVGRAAEGEEITAGEAFDLLSRPNDYQDLPAFLTATVGHLFQTGSVGWILGDMVGRRPRELHVVSGKHLKPKIEWNADGLPVLLGYLYRAPKSGREIAFAPDEVKYFHFWSGTENPLEGLALSAPGRLAIATDYAAAVYNAAMLGNGAEPGMTISFPQNLTQEQREAFVLMLAQAHQGPWKAKRPLVLEGGGKAEPFQTTMQDLQFDQGKKTTRLEICALYGVPPVVAGWVEAAGDSSAYTANALRQFYSETVFPLLDALAPAIQDVASRADASALAWWDVEDQPVVQEMRLGRLTAAKDYFAMGWPPNRINDLLDLGMPDVAWGETGFLPSGLLPASAAAEATLFAPEGEAPYEEGVERGARNAKIEKPPASPGDARKKTERERLGRIAARLWAAFAAEYETLARKGRGFLRLHFARQEKAVIKRLEEALLSGGYAPLKSGLRTLDSGTKSDWEPVIERVLVDVFRDPKEREVFRARLRTYAADGTRVGLRQALVEAGLAGDALTEALRRLTSLPAMEDAIRSDAVRVSTLIDATTRRHLKNSLLQGLQNGETIRDLATRVEGYMQGSRAQAVVIARNAVGQTLSRARHEGQRATGMTHRIWVHSRGPGERRPAHVAAEGYYTEHPVGMDEPFVINNVRLMFPRDHSAGHPEETVNCQCAAIAKRAAPGEEPTAADILDHHAKRVSDCEIRIPKSEIEEGDGDADAD